MAILKIALCIVTVLQFCYAHIEVWRPPPRESPNSKIYQRLKRVDYVNMGPTSSITVGFNQGFCKGKKRGPIVQKVKAGKNLRVDLKDNASHKGGHCEFSVSYDEKNWVSLRTIKYNCLLRGFSFNVPIPKTMPNGRVVLAWTWINREGNREFYMNCIDLEITGGRTRGTVTGPRMLVANFHGYEQYPVVDFHGFEQSGYLFDGRDVITIQPGKKGAVVKRKARPKKKPPTSPNNPPVKQPASSKPKHTQSQSSGQGSCQQNEMKCQGKSILWKCQGGSFVKETCPSNTQCRQEGMNANCRPS